MSNSLSALARDFMARKAKRRVTFSEDDVRRALLRIGLHASESTAFVDYLIRFAGCEVNALHEHVWFMPTSLDHFVDEVGNDLSLPCLLENIDGHWWLESIESSLGVQPLYIDGSGRVFWHCDLSTCIASSIEKYVEGLAFVDQVDSWPTPWFQVIQYLDGTMAEEVLNAISYSIDTAATDVYQWFWRSEDLLLRVFPLQPQTAPPILGLWAFSRSRRRLEVALETLDAYRIDRLPTRWMIDAGVRLSFARQKKR